MCARIRSTPDKRIKEIKNAAMKVFKKNGFANTALENIIDETTLSKGGFYHYYNNTTDILYDLMLDGIEYRNKIIKSKLDEAKNKGNKYFVAEQMVEKITDDNPYMEIYVEFLIEKNTNEKLENLFKKLKADARLEFYQISAEFGENFLDDEKYDLITDLINSLIFGAVILDARKTFLKYKELLIKVIFLIFDNA